METVIAFLIAVIVAAGTIEAEPTESVTVDAPLPYVTEEPAVYSEVEPAVYSEVEPAVYSEVEPSEDVTVYGEEYSEPAFEYNYVEPTEDNSHRPDREAYEAGAYYGGNTFPENGNPYGEEGAAIIEQCLAENADDPDKAALLCRT